MDIDVRSHIIKSMAIIWTHQQQLKEGFSDEECLHIENEVVNMLRSVPEARYEDVLLALNRNVRR